MPVSFDLFQLPTGPGMVERLENPDCLLHVEQNLLAPCESCSMRHIARPPDVRVQ